jgi:hypothetical protein
LATRIYTLFPTSDGFSNHTADNNGSVLYIAASSNRQAYYFAHQRIWVSDMELPAGIVEWYTRGGRPPGDHRLYCGCQIFGGSGVKDADGVKRIREALRAHEASH